MRLRDDTTVALFRRQRFQSEVMADLPRDDDDSG